LALNNPAPQEFVVANDSLVSLEPCPINGKIQINQAIVEAVERVVKRK
jgi:hypothetical protein